MNFLVLLKVLIKIFNFDFNKLNRIIIYKFFFVFHIFRHKNKIKKFKKFYLLVKINQYI